jgi:hypothetical protein
VDATKETQMTQSLIDQEFPEFDNMELFKELRRRLAEHGFEDVSWHNDACPSLMAMVSPDNEEACVKLWVEFADPAMREVSVPGDRPGFSVVIVEKNREDENLFEFILTESDAGEPGECTRLISRLYKEGGQEVAEETDKIVRKAPIDTAVYIAHSQIFSARSLWRPEVAAKPSG